MSKKLVFPLIAVLSIGIGASFAGCSCGAEAKIGSTEPKAPAPPPPPPPPAPEPPPPPPAPPMAIKAMGKVQVEGHELKIPGKIQFDLDKATIKNTPETQELLKSIADTMKANPSVTKLRVEGHTDDKGTLEHNMKLSQERAGAVAEWLAKNGVDKTRLVTVGFGPARSLVPNDSEANREKNRRTEFHIWEHDGKPTKAQEEDAKLPQAGAAPATATSTTPAAADGKAPTTKAAAPATPKK